MHFGIVKNQINPNSSIRNIINPFNLGPVRGINPDRGDYRGHVGERVLLIDPLLAE